MLEKFEGCLLSLALGDAMGSHRHGTLLRYSDDTAMTLALAEALIERGGPDPEHIARKYLEAWEREPWRGYGPGPPRIFRMIRRGLGPLRLDQRLYPGGSYGNGAAMRIAPVALLYHDDPEAMREAVEAASIPTHSHPLGIEGAALQAAAITIALKTPQDGEPDIGEFLQALEEEAKHRVYREKIREVGRLLEMDPPPSEVARRLGNTVEAFNSVPTAIYLYLRNQDPLKTIQHAIDLRGDTDTIASMAAAIAGAHKTASPIPTQLLNRLENKEKIRQTAQKLWKLKQRVPPR